MVKTSFTVVNKLNNVFNKTDVSDTVIGQAKASFWVTITIIGTYHQIEHNVIFTLKCPWFGEGFGMLFPNLSVLCHPTPNDAFYSSGSSVHHLTGVPLVCFHSFKVVACNVHWVSRILLTYPAQVQYHLLTSHIIKYRRCMELYPPIFWWGAEDRISPPIFREGVYFGEK